MSQSLFAQKPVLLYPSDTAVEIRVGEQMVTRLHFTKDLPKPVLYPVTSTEGTEITRGFPLNPREGDRIDHPHHIGIWFNHGDVNGLDFWNNSDAIAEEKRDKYGAIVPVKILTTRSDAHGAIIETLSEWQNHEGRPLLKEKTSYLFSVDGNAWILDRKTRLSALGDPVTFSDSKEGMYGIRLRQELELPTAKPARRIDATGKVSATPITEHLLTSGSYLTSEGLTDDDAWGKTARWIRLSGNVEGKTISIIFMDHPGNQNFPAYWHARDYGLFAVNNLGRQSYNKKEDQVKFTLTKKQSTTFFHRMIVVEGAPPDAAKIENWYKEFVQK
ncbi:MAG: PmoA family protein [Bacteroidia bacterium]